VSCRQNRRPPSGFMLNALRNKTPRQVHDDVSGFAREYVEDWNRWLHVESDQRWQMFGKTLRKWQATRPKRMRRLEQDARHDPPYLDDLIRKALRQLDVVGDLAVSEISKRTAGQDNALQALWGIFEALPVSGVASCVGITKAILLLTDGRIGPALDSRVRQNLGITRPSSTRDWICLLDQIEEDISSFEARHNCLLREIVPIKFAQLEYGRLYDMALGPR